MHKEDEKSEQINRPILGRGLRALAMRPVGNSDFANPHQTPVEDAAGLCATSACRKSGTLAL
ncbi:MAG: hypothetical protein AAF423_07760 [Pseudomonadota bacterium]